MNGYWSVLGEDLTNGPFGSCHQSQNCICDNPLTGGNLTLWAVLCGATATEETTWGQLRSLYR